MAILDSIRRFFSDPPPAYVFEISSAGIAAARVESPEHISFHELDPGALTLSPLSNNLKDPDAFAATVASIFPEASQQPRPAALILPDFSARLQILDFDTFPASEEEQQALVRFRVKKTVPFDVDSAAVSSWVQTTEKGRTEVVAALTALEILAPFEAAFRNARFHPGFVTTSALATLNLVSEPGLTLLGKLSGNTFTVLVIDKQRIKMFRCLELERGSPVEMLGTLETTLAFVEDTFSARPSKLLLCGFGNAGHDAAAAWQQQLRVPAEVLRSSRGFPGANNAGIYGYLESQSGRSREAAA